MSHVAWAASYATTGSLARAFAPGGRLATVRPGRSPLRHVAPSFVVTAKPTFVAAPSKRRPTWNVATVVRPKVKLSGSTSVSCCASGGRVRVAREPPADELAVARDDVREVGVHDVERRPAAHDVARAVVRRRDRSFPGPASCVSRPGPPWRKSAPLPDRRSTVAAREARGWTSARGVPTSRSFPAVPVTIARARRAPTASSNEHDEHEGDEMRIAEAEDASL